METKLAAGITAFKDGVAALKTNPRRIELLKPSVMLAVSIIVVVAYSFDLTNAANALKATALSDEPYAGKLRDMTLMAWSLNFQGLAMGVIMTALLYLAGTYSNITRGKNEKIYKLAATTIHTALFLVTVAMFFTMNDHQRIPVLLVAASVIMATMLIMTAVERHLIKRSEPLNAAVAH